MNGAGISSSSINKCCGKLVPKDILSGPLKPVSTSLASVGRLAAPYLEYMYTCFYLCLGMVFSYKYDVIHVMTTRRRLGFFATSVENESVKLATAMKPHKRAGGFHEQTFYLLRTRISFF